MSASRPEQLDHLLCERKLTCKGTPRSRVLFAHRLGPPEGRGQESTTDFIPGQSTENCLKMRDTEVQREGTPVRPAFLPDLRPHTWLCALLRVGCNIHESPGQCKGPCFQRRKRPLVLGEPAHLLRLSHLGHWTWASPLAAPGGKQLPPPCPIGSGWTPLFLGPLSPQHRLPSPCRSEEGGGGLADWAP